MSKITIDNLFINVIWRFKEWLKSKPTGRFTIEFNVNQGGVRGKPKIKLTEDI